MVVMVRDSLYDAIPELYSAYMMDYLKSHPQSTNFNYSFVYKFPLNIDIEKILSVWQILRMAHPSLECIMIKHSNRWTIEYCPEKAIPVSYYKSLEAEINQDIMKAIQPFLPGNGMFRLSFFETEKNIYMLVDIYHAIIDGTGMNNLLLDFCKVWEGKQLIYDDYLLLLKKRAEIDTIADKLYFEQKYGGIDWDTSLRPDYLEHGIAQRIEVPLSDDIHYSNSHMLTGVLAAIAEYNGSQDVMATWTFHSRMLENEKHSTGLFIRDFPVGLHIKNQSMDELFLDIKSQVKGAIAHMSYSYQMIEYNEKPIVYTTFQKNIPFIVTPSDIQCEAWNVIPPDQLAEDALLILAHDDNCGRRLSVTYDSGMYSEESIRKFMLCVKENMQQITL